MATADYPRSTSPATPPAPTVGDPTTTLLQGLSRLGTRRNRHLITRALMLWATLGLALSTVGVFAYRLYLIDGEPWMVAVPIVLALLIGALLGWRARRGPFDAALDADRALGLKENLSSALAFARPDLVKRAPAMRTVSPMTHRSPERAATPIRQPLKARLKAALAVVLRALKGAGKETPLPYNVGTTQWVPFLVSEAAGRAAGLQPKSVYPWHWKRRDALLLVSLLTFVGVCLMSNLNWLRSAQQVKEAHQLQEPAKTLQMAAKKVQDDKKLSEDPKAKQLAKKMAALGRKMMRGHMGKRDALVAMAQLKRDLQQAVKSPQSKQDQNDFSKFQQALQDQPMQSPEGQQMQQALKDKDLEKAAKQLDDLAKKLESGKMSEEEKKQAAEDLKKAAEALRKQGGAENEAAAKQLEQAAKQLQQQQQKAGQQSQQQNQSGQQQAQQQGKKPGQQGKQGQGQNGQNQSQQNQKGQQQQQSGSQGSQSQPGGQQAQPGQQQSNQSAAGALRQMANSMRGSQMGNSQAMQNMLSKIRQAEQQASQSPGSQAGQGPPGQGQGPGQSGSGESTTPGKDLKPTDPHGQVGGGPGLGQRNNATGSKAGGGVSNKKSTRTGDKRQWSGVWSERLPKTHKRIDRVTGQLGNDGDVDTHETQTEAKGGPVNTPYYNVYESYKKDAEDAVSKEQVPPAYRQPVKNYFDSLKPNG